MEYAVRTRQWTRAGYDRLIEIGVFQPGGLEDYWILNLVDRVLEVYREPVADAASAFGWRYRSRQTLAADASIAPIAAPHAAIRVADLLP
jgi:hypothetical protein